MTDIDLEHVDVEIPGKEPPLRRVLIICAAWILIVLIVSFSFSNPLVNFLKSVKVIDGKVTLPNAEIVFTNQTLERLQNEFVNNQHREIKACLFGQKDTNYIISDISFPHIIDASVVHVESIRCPQTVLIDVHSHPIYKCVASDVDKASLKALKEQNPSVLGLIMCAKDRFALV